MPARIVVYLQITFLIDHHDISDMDDGDSKTQDRDPLDAGQSVARSLTFNAPSGDYDMNLVLNG